MIGISDLRENVGHAPDDSGRSWRPPVLAVLGLAPPPQPPPLLPPAYLGLDGMTTLGYPQANWVPHELHAKPGAGEEGKWPQDVLRSNRTRVSSKVAS